MIGSEEFRRSFWRRCSRRWMGGFGAEARESADEQADPIVAEKLRKVRWDEAELGLRRKDDRQKVRIAQRLGQETTMTVGWTADRLRMGTCPHSTHLLYLAERGQ